MMNSHYPASSGPVQQLKAHVRAIALLLYSDAQAAGLPMRNWVDIEQTVRTQLQSHVSPGQGIFHPNPLPKHG